jgi:hypothetical protein
MHKPKKTGIGHNKQFGKLLSRGSYPLVPKHEQADILVILMFQAEQL